MDTKLDYHHCITARPPLAVLELLIAMDTEERARNDVPTIRGTASGRPLSALLSQVLVAFTVEFDNEFERRMGQAGYEGARLSLLDFELPHGLPGSWEVAKTEAFPPRSPRGAARLSLPTPSGRPGAGTWPPGCGSGCAPTNA